MLCMSRRLLGFGGFGAFITCWFAFITWWFAFITKNISRLYRDYDKIVTTFKPENFIYNFIIENKYCLVRITSNVFQFSISIYFS